MITNLLEEGMDGVIETAGGLPGGGIVWRRLREGDEPFFAVRGGAGLEWGVANEIKGAPNRSRLKLVVPEGRDDLVALFAYKTSQIAWSRDRYAYGVWEIPVRDGRAELDPGELEAWLAFQISGFHPEKRPHSLLRQISYDIPE